MIEIANSMWKFTGCNRSYPSTIYLRDDEILGAIIDNERLPDPQLVLLTAHSGHIHVSWVEHHEEIIDYIEGKNDAREALQE